ncbi:hypothetical protein [Paralimibaculum aggregatum]|nr:hypothetical protein [Limibaculum sp. NKW23]
MIKTDPMAPWAGPASEAFKLWISFFPTAPLFGVEWRFAGSFPAFGTQAFDMKPGQADAPKAAEAAKAAAATMVKAAEESVEQAAAFTEAAVEAGAAVTDAALETVETAAEVAETTIETTLGAATEMAEIVEFAPIEAAPEAAPEPAPVEETVETVVEAAAEAVEDTAEAVEEPAEIPSAAIRPETLYDAAPAVVDDLKQLKGVGPSLESKLNAMGIYRFEQIAGFSEENLIWVDDQLTSFKGRCFRDDWVGQARSLIG